MRANSFEWVVKTMGYFWSFLYLSRWLFRVVWAKVTRRLPRSLDGDESSTTIGEKTDPCSSPCDTFAECNASAWCGKHLNAEREANEAHVLIEGLVAHPAYMVTNLVAGGHIMGLLGMGGTGFLSEPDQKTERLFRSYGVRDFVYLSDADDAPRSRLSLYIEMALLLAHAPTPDDLLLLKRKDIFFGKAVYDDYLRINGVGTVDRIDEEFLHLLVRAAVVQDQVESLFGSGRFRVLIQNERQFIPGTVIYQTALKHGVDVYSEGGGPTHFTVRRFRLPEEAYMNLDRPDEALYDYVYERFQERAEEKGMAFMQSRFSGKPRPQEFESSRRAFKRHLLRPTREELCAEFGWDPSKKIVGILANTLTDGVFTNRWAIFRDNLTWLRETLKKCIQITDVNWLIKAHPSDERNLVKTTTKGEYERYVQECDHVCFLPYDVSSTCLPDILDAVFTAHGSAGIEYSCFGIPCVLGGESLYSGFGFAHEPQDCEEYFAQMRSVSELQPLSAECVRRAKVFTYVYMVLSRVTTALIPENGLSANWNDATFWQEMEEHVVACPPADDRMRHMLKIQMEGEYRHLMNYDWVGLDSSGCILGKEE